MAFKDASETRLAFVTETVAGATPATPAFANLRFNSETLNRNYSHQSSNEIRPDRNVSDQVLLGESAGGGIVTEMSYGSYDPLFEALLQGTFASDILKNGKTKKSMTFEKTFDLGGTELFHRYTGVQVDSMAMELSPQGFGLLNWSLLGLGGSQATAAITGATYAAANANPVLNTSSHITGLALTGTGITSAMSVSSLSLSISNNLREQPKIGSRTLGGIGSGRCEVSGNISVYFENNEAIDTVEAETALALAFTAGHTAGSRYTFTLPSLKLSNPQVTNGGNGSDVIAQFELMGIYDATEDCTIKIERAI